MASFSPEEYFVKVDNMILISFQSLRQLFQKRWKKETGKDWGNSEEQGKSFCENEGKHILKMSNDKFLKEKLLNGCLENWDMTILSLVLRNFGDQTTYKVENDAVGELKDMRNKLAHHGTKRFSKTEYNEKVMKFRTCLRAIEVKDSEIDNIIEKAGNTSSSTALAIKVLYEQADECIQKENFVKALEFYDEATTMHSLLPEHQGVAYEKRAECHLKLADQKNQNHRKDEADKCIAQAMLDATTALELNDNSWIAHYIIAKCHRLQKNLDLAIQHFHKALSISPTQKHVKEDLHSCKALLAIYKREDNVDPRYLPMNLTERIAHLEAETGFKPTHQEFLNLGTHANKLIKGQGDVFRGHQHIMGWNVQQSDIEAFRYYEKAANVGNADGIYNLAQCYRKAIGVAQDLSKAYNLYLRAANMSPYISEIIHGAGNKMPGVAEAQHYLGIMYQDGIHVERDYCEAVKWYTKATENGYGNAANNLAIMYSNGLGVPKDEKKAEMYWNQAVTFKDPNAAASLMIYYANQLEPDKSRAMFRAGKQLGHTGLSGLTEQEFDDWLESTVPRDFDRRKYEDEVIAYEKEKNLDIKGMTFFERLFRYMFTKDKKVEELRNSFKEIESNEGCGGRMTSITGWDKSHIHQMRRLADQGSSAAERVLRTMIISWELRELLARKQLFDERDKNVILNLYYEYVTLNLSTGMGLLIYADGKPTLDRIIRQLFDSKCDGRRNEEEMKVRLCYVFLNKISSLKPEHSYMEELLQQGIRMYPENIHYYHFLSSLYANRGAWKSALEWAENGLSKFPDQVDLLYAKAVHIRQLPEEDEAKLCIDTRQHESSRIHKLLDKGKRMNEEKKKAIPAYKEFINKAPTDHRKLPEAYYSLAHFYIQDVMPHRKTKPEKLTALPSYKKLEHYYNMGKEAEGNMLPCYLPYGESDTKKWVELTLNLVKENASNTPVSPSSPRPSNSSSTLSSVAFNSCPVSKRTCDLKRKSQPEPTKSILERKQYLTSPIRKDLILRHRKTISAFEEARKKYPNSVNIGRTQAPALRQTAPTRMSLMKPITLNQMNPTSDHIYKDRVLDLTIIEDPCFGFPSVHLVAEDDNGDVTRLYIYNVEQNRETAKQLGHGATIAILNPYMRIGSQDITNGIRNDEPSCLIYLEGLEKMCRFCGMENAQHRCSKCMKASYCSRECQIHDYKIMKHNLICWE